MTGTTSSITVQSLGKIVQRAPSVGAETWRLYLLPAGLPPSGKLPILNLLTGQKSGFFRRTGATRCTDSRQIWHGRRVPGSAWLCNNVPQSAQGRIWPQNIKNFHFLIKSRAAGANPLTDF